MAHCMTLDEANRTTVPDGIAPPPTNRDIATQCCDGEGAVRCRRRFDVDTREQGWVDDLCINGRSADASFQRFTYVEAVNACSSYGLSLCRTSCKKKGCGYDNHLVYSDLPCTRL